MSDRTVPNVAHTLVTAHIVGMSAQHAVQTTEPKVLTEWGLEFTNPAGNRARITFGMSAADRRDAFRNVRMASADQNPVVVCRSWECTSDWVAAVAGED